MRTYIQIGPISVCTDWIALLSTATPSFMIETKFLFYCVIVVWILERNKEYSFKSNVFVFLSSFYYSVRVLSTAEKFRAIVYLPKDRAYIDRKLSLAFWIQWLRLFFLGVSICYGFWLYLSVLEIQRIRIDDLDFFRIWKKKKNEQSKRSYYVQKF